MRIHNVKRASFPLLVLVVAAMALACGGAESAPAMAQYAEEPSAARDFTEQESLKAQSASAGADGFSPESGFAATPAMAAAMPAAAAPTPAPAAAQASTESAAARPQQPQVSDSPQPQSARKLIVESWISLEVTNIDASVRQVESLAGQSGGWVESSEVFGEAGYRSATVRIRVPADRLSNGLDSLRAMGRVTDEGVSSTDVTDRLIDNEARLTAWYAQEERLVTLLENAPTVEDIIQIEQRIAEVRSDIEHVEATQRDLTGRVATSLITVNLRLPAQYAADPPVGNLELTTGDPSAVADAIVARVDALDGYVGEKRSYDAGEGSAVDLIVFVKPADLAPLMDYAGTLGAASGRQLTSVGPAPINEVPNARFTLAIRSNVYLEASLLLSTSDPLSIAERIRDRAESLGGYVDRWDEARRDQDDVNVVMALVVKSSDLRDVMEHGASLGEIEHWSYSALGQDPATDAPDARLQVTVFTKDSDAAMWIVIGAVVAAAAAIVISIVVLLLRRRGSRAAGVRTVADLEPEIDE